MTDHLLAAAVDHLAIANWMFSSVHRDEDAEPLELPTPIPRPGSGEHSAYDGESSPDRDRTGPTAHELALFFGS